MLELPEVVNISRQINHTLKNKKIEEVKFGYFEHKFTFFNKTKEEYRELLVGKKITSAQNYGYYIQINIEDVILIVRDGISLRYHENEKTLPVKHQIYIRFDDNTYLTSTTTMYGFVGVYKVDEVIEDKYFNADKNNILPLDDKFDLEYFKELYNKAKPVLSSKAFLATEQRISGIGNGTVQDILFYSKLNPKRKINTYTEEDIERLFNSIKNVLNKMIEQGGRDTEKDLFGNNGGYKTVLSKNTIKEPCIVCRGELKKESFLGGSIYYCPNCQK